MVRCAVEHRCDQGLVARVFGKGTRMSGELAELLLQGATPRVPRGLQISKRGSSQLRV